MFDKCGFFEHTTIEGVATQLKAPVSVKTSNLVTERITTKRSRRRSSARRVHGFASRGQEKPGVQNDS